MKFTHIVPITLAVVLATLTLQPAQPAYAATFSVDNIGDAAGGACDIDIPNDCSLRSAIEQANLTSDNDAITFDDTVFTDASNSTITLTSQLPDIADASTAGTLTITGPESTDVIIQASTCR